MDYAKVGYLKEIPDVEWAQEVIMERFDNALELMPVGSIVYGGAIRDCLAGLELLGDLDISTAGDDFHVLLNRLHKNAKWAPNEEEPTTGKLFPTMEVEEIENRPFPESYIAFKARRSVTTSPKNSGDIAQELAPMSKITAFRTLGNKVVQVMKSKQSTNDNFQDSVYMVRTVDIICCGVIMSYDGRVFEIIPGAYQDCLDRVLRLNTPSEIIYVDALPNRVAKLVERGWKNEIDVEKAIRNVKTIQKRARKKMKRQLASMRRKATLDSDRNSVSIVENFPLVGSKNKNINPSGFIGKISKEDIDTYYMGNFQLAIQKLRDIAIDNSFNIRTKISPFGNIHYTVNDGNEGNIISTVLWNCKQHKFPAKLQKTTALPATGQELPNPYTMYAPKSWTIQKKLAKKAPRQSQPIRTAN